MLGIAIELGVSLLFVSDLIRVEISFLLAQGEEMSELKIYFT